MVLKTLIAAESHIVQQVHKHCASQNNCFELFGFDIMLDRTGQARVSAKILTTVSLTSEFMKYFR